MTEQHFHRFALTDWDGSEKAGTVSVASVVCECGQAREVRTTAARDEFEKQLAAFNVNGEPAEEPADA